MESRLTLVLAVQATARNVDAEVVEFTNKDDWIAATGSVTTIDFTGLAPRTIITNEYVGQGVIFTDDDNDAAIPSASLVNDDLGIADGTQPLGPTITLVFSTPQHAIGAHFPGGMRIDLYSGDDLIHSSSNFGDIDAGYFGGVISEKPFDRVVLTF